MSDFKTLLSHGRGENNKDDCDNTLQTFVGNLELSKMISMVTKRISDLDGVQALKYLLLGLSNDNKSQKKRLKLCEGVLNEAQEKELPGRILFDLVMQIVLEVEKFSTPHLVKLCDLCVDFIRTSKSPSQTSWKELLPKLLSVIETRKEVDHDGTEMSGTDYKNRIIQAVCMSNWDTSIITSLTAMFIELKLNTEQLGEVVKKLCKSLEELPAEEIPPFVHQLLELCKDHHANNVFLTLRVYFDKHIYKLDEDHQPPDSMEIESCDLIEAQEKSGVKDCEGTVLYHIDEAAKVGHGCVNQLLRFAKTCSNCPERLIDPFILAVLLSFSSISSYETQVITLLRNAFIRNVAEEERKTDSAWLRTMIPSHCNLERILTRLIESSACERDKVLKGLVNLSFSLMSCKKSAPLQNPESLWKLGQMITVMLIKRQRQVTATILQQLTNGIFYSQSDSHFTDCLHKICETNTFVVLENQSTLLNSVDFLNQLPGELAEGIVSAILPVVRISSKLRDNLILALRKALFSKQIETRKMAVYGFLKLLKYLKIKSLSALSQSSSYTNFSGPSVFSQMCTDVYQAQSSVNNNSNEVLCLELVGILKRCFMLQAPVKTSLYEGLYGMVKRNPELGPNVLDILLNHFSNYYVADKDTLPPLDFNKTVTIQGIDAVLQEPLGQLLFAMQQIVVLVKQNMEDDDNDEYCSSFEKLSVMLESLSQRLCRCDLNHFELDEETNLLDILPECLQRQQVLYQIIAVYESMMAYTANSWTVESTKQQGQTLHSLFKGFSLLYDYIKNCKSSKKKDAPKKTKEKLEAGKKYPPFKPPVTILNMNAVNRFLELLLCEDVDWTNKEAVTDLKSRRPFYRYVFQATMEVLQHTAKIKKSPTLLKECSQLGRILYKRCLARFAEFNDFDLSSAVSSVECFSELLSYVASQHKSRFPVFLAEIGNTSVESGLSAQLKPFIRIYQQLLVDTATDTDTEEAYLKRLLLAVINGLSTLTLQLPVYQPFALKITDWLLEFAQKKSLPSGVHTKAFMSLLLTMLLRCKTEAPHLDNMALQLCHIFGTYNEEELEECQMNLSVLNEAVVFAALPMLCSTLLSILENIRWLLSRLRSEISVFALPAASPSSPNTRRDMRKRKEKELVQQAGLCVNVGQTVASIAVSAGPCTEAVFQFVTRTFATLTDITKYFTACCTQQSPLYQDARFGKVVKLAGFHLSSQVGELILYVEDPVKDKENKKRDYQLAREAKKQTQYIPKLVSELENFSRCINILSNRCKDKSLADSLKLTTTRDFRLNTKKLEEIMNQNQTVLDESMEIEDEAQQPSQASNGGSSQPSQKPQKRRRTAT